MTGFVTHRTDGLVWLERPGSGRTLVLLHGIGSNANSFAPLLPYLPADLRVIVWNAPGYGGSEPLPQDWPLAQDYASRLQGFADRLELARFDLLGHSLGALMAAAFAASRRDRVIRLTLASPAIGHGVSAGGALSAAAQARIDDLEAMCADAFASARAPKLVHRPEAHPEVVALVRDGMAQVTMPGYGQAARMLASGRLLDDAERLSVPTDVIVGAEDRVTPPESARRVHAALHAQARGAFTELSGCGHAIYQQDPARFARAMAEAAAPVA